MKIINNNSDKAMLLNIGSKIARYRLNRNMTQRALAGEAGVSLPTVQRAEKGRSIQLVKLLRILRALDLLANFDILVPESVVSPLQQFKMNGKQRQRASVVKQDKGGKAWEWGDN
jgi:transcriptional regulator with XRE-family HTH domain